MSGLPPKLSTSPELERSKSSGRPWERGFLLQKKSSGTCPLTYNGSPVPWREIADWISDEEGYFVCDQTVRNNFNAVLERLKEKMLEDPYIRDWLDDRDMLPEG